MDKVEMDKYVKAELILDNKDKDKYKEKQKIKIPEEVFSKVVEKLKEHKKIVESKECIEEIKKSTKNLYEVTMRPELQEGIDCGDYIWKDYALEIRDGETGKFVGKAQLKKSDIIDTKEVKETITRESKPSAISNITRSICSISGQIQLAEISQKLDALNDKVDDIKELLIDKEVCKLKACIETIQEDSILIHDSYANDRINKTLGTLRELSKFFEGEIYKVINRKISYNILKSFSEGLFNIKDLLFGNVKEYNNKYIDDIKDILNEYSFLVDCYFKSVVSLGICYQILYSYNEAKKYYEQAYNDINKFSLEISNKLVYLLDIQEIKSDEYIDLSNILNAIENRKLMLKEELINTNSCMKNINNEYIELIQQFDNVRIKMLVSEDELLKGERN